MGITRLPAWLGCLVLGGAAVAGLTAAPTWLRNQLWGFVAVGVVLAMAYGIRRHGPPAALAWWALFAGVLCWSVGHVWFRTGHTGPTPDIPFLSAQDVPFLASKVCLAVGLAGLVVRRAARGSRESTLDAAVVTVGLVVLAWTLAVNPYLQAGPSGAELTVFVAYVVGDLLYFALTARLAFSHQDRGPAHRLVFAGLLVLLAAELMYGSTVVLGPDPVREAAQDAGWLGWTVLLAAAALHPDVARAPRHDPGAELRAGRLRVAVFVPLILLNPTIVTANHLLIGESQGAWWTSTLLPVALTTCLAILLVVRLVLLAGVAQRRATALDAALQRQETLQRQLEHRALHDALTGLGNRTLLGDRLAHTLANGRGGHLLLLDLDGFKNVNDTLGHVAGDELLVEVGRRLRATVPAADTVVRLGGDEFAALLSTGDPRGATALAEQVVTQLRVPYRVAGRELYLTASVGLRALRPPLKAGDAMREADLALYAAKEGGKDAVVRYDPSLANSRSQHVQLAAALRRAISERTLHLHYQPVVDLRTGQPVAVEALARWTMADGTKIRPDQFIPVAESTGLINPLGAWILGEACADARRWWEGHGVAVTVNVSGRQLCDPDFPTTVLDRLRTTGLPGYALVIEITETVLVGGAGAELAISHLQRLRQEGVRIAVDDFGTGHSSLAYLRHLPIDILKLDRAFTGGVAGLDATNRSLSRAVLDLGRALRLATIAEGVETPDQATVLRRMGCPLGQGMYFAPPMPATEVDRLLSHVPARVPAMR
jgi:diguanylate cyclase (GGDEF)-like protein